MQVSGFITMLNLILCRPLIWELVLDVTMDSEVSEGLFGKVLMLISRVELWLYMQVSFITWHHSNCVSVCALITGQPFGHSLSGRHHRYSVCEVTVLAASPSIPDMQACTCVCCCPFSSTHLEASPVGHQPRFQNCSFLPRHKRHTGCEFI